MKEKLNRISDFIWELPPTYKKGMKVPVRVIASEKLIEKMEEVVLQQAANVASLPGLVGYVVVLPDAHSGYGAPIGCVFALDPDQGGIISPGAVGYDISCGMRLITTNLSIDEVRPKLSQLVNFLFDYVPPGVGREGFLRISDKELGEIMIEGASFMVKKGFGWSEDLEHVEAKGKIAGAEPSSVSQKARERGRRQLATLGSGNHYLEIQQVEKIFDPQKAKSLGIFDKDQVVVMVHCGSRGFGHQVATDYLRIFEKKLEKYQIKVADLQLACAPFTSSDGQNYYQAMAAASNFAFANRQLITYRTREVFEKVFGKKAEDLGMKLVYDVAHNIAKVEEHAVPMEAKSDKDTSGVASIQGFIPRIHPEGLLRGGEIRKKLIVHRKGATRSFPGQPVIIGGSMETGSYLLVGGEKSMGLSFGSTAHGSGRTMSRHQAKKIVCGEDLSRKMASEGIVVKSASWGGLAEEAGVAYKNITDVIESVAKAGISIPLASFKPIGNIKG